MRHIDITLLNVVREFCGPYYKYNHGILGARSEYRVIP